MYDIAPYNRYEMMSADCLVDDEIGSQYTASDGSRASTIVAVDLPNNWWDDR